MVDIVIVGLGATGLAITEALASRTDCRIVGAADMSRYGAIAKFGHGQSPDEFLARRDEGRVMGHVGFAQSIAAIARGLEWSLDQIEVDVVEPDIVAAEDRQGEHRLIPASTVARVVHRALGRGDEVRSRRGRARHPVRDLQLERRCRTGRHSDDRGE